MPTQRFNWRSDEKKERKYVACSDCRHLIWEDEAQYVKGVGMFCKEHQKAYTRFEGGWFGWTTGTNYPESFFKEMEVSEDGTPIGYVKAPEPKNEPVSRAKRGLKLKYHTARERLEAKRAASRRYSKKYYRKMHPKK